MRQIRTSTAAAIVGFGALGLLATPGIAASGQARTDNSAKSALHARYARGEINRGECLERKGDLA
jgi:hypothetical protein